ncbi:MAG: hypothetical protein ACRD24_08400 [Terriglobales bacterium]
MNPIKNGNLIMNSSVMFLFGFGVGAGLMFLLDPDRGRDRRAKIQQKTVGTLKEMQHKAAETAEDVARRARGLVAEARRAL